MEIKAILLQQTPQAYYFHTSVNGNSAKLEI